MAAPPQIFDRQLIARRLATRAERGPDFVSELVTKDLGERLVTISRRFEKAMIMGPYARDLPDQGLTAEGGVAFERIATLVEGDVPLIDPEHLSLPATDYDLIVSLLDLQIVNDVPGFLARIRAHLRPDGLMLLAAIGGNSLQELRAAWLAADAEILGGAYPRVAPFIDVRAAGALLQRAGFALPVADVEPHVVRYAEPVALMSELKRLGASNPLCDRGPKPVTRAHLIRAATAYAAAAGDPDGRVRATLEILWLSGWAPHESQQKPLAPGSAEVSLTRVLPTRKG